MQAGIMLKAIYDEQNNTPSVNITEVNGSPVSSIDEFKADVSNLDVDLSTIPQAVWEHVPRTLTEILGLTPEQEDTLNQILIEVQNRNEWVVTI